MIDGSVVEATLGPRLSWETIKVQYPDQWVVLVEMEWDDDVRLSRLRSAIVAGHGPGKLDPLTQTDALRPRYSRMGHFFTGRVRPLPPPRAP